MKLAIVACSVLEDEIAALVEPGGPVFEFVRLPQGLHNDPPDLRRQLQAMVDDVEARSAPDAIVLGYGLCSRGVEGVTTRHARLVVPRAHDCITLLLGCRKRYQAEVDAHPGTYWYSPGWNRHHLPPGPERWVKLRKDYAEQFGDDNADYLMEAEQHWFRTYRRAAYVHLGAGPVEPEAEKTRACADWLGWKFDRIDGDPSLLRDLVNGRWDDDRFLVLEPGHTLRMTADDRVIEAAPVAEH